MKDPKGAVIIGCVHRGQKNAEKVIAVLKKNGIKEGDLIGVEHSRKNLNEIIAEVGSNRPSAFTILQQQIKIIQFQNAIKALPFSETISLRATLFELKGNLHSTIFKNTLFKFLLSKKVKFMPFDVNWKANVHSTQIVVPVREKFWGKKFKGKKPQFVIAGTAHLSALKKIVPYRKAITTNKIVHFIQKPFEVLIRTKYKLRKTKNQRKRRKLKPLIK